MPEESAALATSVADGETLVHRLVDGFGPGSVFVELQDNAVQGDRRATGPPRLPTPHLAQPSIRSVR
jgi:hypothetical protein